jgi:small subunit ribosomal protein S6
MRHYEIMVILDAGLEEEAIRAVLDRASQLLSRDGSTVEKVDRWGKRRFAYEVHHKGEGYYALIEARAEPAAVAEVHRMLGLADEVIRHKVIRLPEKVVVRSSSGARPASTGEGEPVAAEQNGAS